MLRIGFVIAHPVLLLSSAGLALAPRAPHAAPPAPHQAAPDVAAVFKSKCAMCHGADGKGSEMGKSLMVRDLTSAQVQGETDETLYKVITEGKDNMPAFGEALPEDQRKALVQYVRTFAAPAHP